jgi:TatD DNase family protein
MTDAHCHPWDLLGYLETTEEERRKTGTVVAASSWNLEQFEYHEGLAQKAQEDGAAEVFRCFALHPQLSEGGDFFYSDGIELLQSLGAEGRLDAVGETGFDLYNAQFRAGEKIQEEMFALHLETALQNDLPMVLHVRRAMHKIFPYAKELKKLPAVVFHSWPGTRGEGEALLRRGINAFFSFGSAVLKNHKEAIISAAHLSLQRILLETDAPYQPPRGKTFSSWQDLDAICSCIASLRKDSGCPGAYGEELRNATTANFSRVFSL